MHSYHLSITYHLLSSRCCIFLFCSTALCLSHGFHEFHWVRVCLQHAFQFHTRTLWLKAVAVSKSTLDLNAALSKASSITTSLTTLERAVIQKELAPEQEWVAIHELHDVLGLLTSQDVPADQAHLVGELSDAKASLIQHSPNLASVVQPLEAFLKTQWQEDSQELGCLKFESKEQAESACETLVIPSVFAGG